MPDAIYNPAPQLPSPTPPRSSKLPLLIIGIVLLVLIVGGIGLALLFKASSKPAVKAVKATHSKIYKADITFGKNRAVNACNVMPVSLTDAQFGDASDLDRNVVTETIIESSVPESSINPVDGDAGVTDCLRGLGGGSSAHLSFDGFRSLESAKAAYEHDLAYDRKSPANTITPVPGMTASTIIYTDHIVTLEGAHDNYTYKLEVESGVTPGALSKDALIPKTIAVAKQIVANMDDPKVSTHPSAVPTVSTVGGTNQIDPCQLFDAATFEQGLLSHSTFLTQHGFPKTAYQANVGRQYSLDGKASIGDTCSRQSAPKPFKDISIADALKDAFIGGSENANITLDGFTNADDAQHNVDVLSDSAAEQLSGIGDKATYGQGGLEASIKQLAFSKGNYSVEITANYGDGTATNVVPEADFIALAKALAAKLP